MADKDFPGIACEVFSIFQFLLDLPPDFSPRIGLHNQKNVGIMKTQTESKTKLTNLIATVTAAPNQSAKHGSYTEMQMYVQLNDGRTVKIYSFNQVATAAISTIAERSKLVIFGKFIASDAFRMTSWKAI
jgi:hypothetical protein